MRLRGSRTGSGGGVLWREALVSCEVKGGRGLEECERRESLELLLSLPRCRQARSGGGIVCVETDRQG